MGMINARISFVSKWARFLFEANSTALKKWYVWLSGSKGGITSARNNVIIINIKKDKVRIIKDLSSIRAFFNLLKLIEFFMFKFWKFIFFQRRINIIISPKFIKIMFFASIELKRDKISILKIIIPKNTGKIIRAFLVRHAII